MLLLLTACRNGLGLASDLLALFGVPAATGVLTVLLYWMAELLVLAWAWLSS